MRILAAIFVLFFLCGFSYAQEIKKAEKFLGVWRYKYDLGIEKWTLSESGLLGESFRKNKYGDSTKVETILMRNNGKIFIHEWNTYNVIDDSLIVNRSTFVSTSQKMKFYNVDDLTPYMIAYRFGFLRSNKLIIKVQYGLNDRPVKFVLDKIKD